MTIESFDIETTVLFRDALILVINKPAGMAVHQGRGPAPNLEVYLPKLQYDLPKAPELAHRLDMETSGCLILGRNRHALRTIATLLETRQITKVYHALVHGRPPADQGRIDMGLSNLTGKSYHWRMKCDPAGKSALTDYELVGTFSGYSLLKLTPLTGRTHQLRVHCAHLGCPIVGDSVYGDATLDEALGAPAGLHLHASQVTIPLYYKKPPLVIDAPRPERMERLLEAERA
jgi:RluA family pseudouridine synthase